MRAWLFVLAVLATFNRVQQVASTEEVKSSSSSISSYTSSSSDSSSLESNNVDLSDSIERDNLRGNKPDPQTLVQIEKNLLSLFGFEKRPKVDRSKIVIPEAMKKLYAQIMGHELDSLDVPKADLHNKDANTIRSYTHEGESESEQSHLTVHKSISSRFRLKEEGKKSNEEKPLNQLQCVSSAARAPANARFPPKLPARFFSKLDLRSIMLRNYVLDDRIIDLARSEKKILRRRKKSQEKLQKGEKENFVTCNFPAKRARDCLHFQYL